MPQYFVVKHDLESFTLMPGLIWRTNSPKKRKPIGLGFAKGVRLEPGRRLINFLTRPEPSGRDPARLPGAQGVFRRRGGVGSPSRARQASRTWPAQRRADAAWRLTVRNSG